MKAIILLAVLAVAAARPEAPLNGGHSNGHRRINGLSHRYGPPTASAFAVAGNGQGNGNGKGNGNGNGNGLSQGFQASAVATFNEQNGDALSTEFNPPPASNGATFGTNGIGAHSSSNGRNGGYPANGVTNGNGNVHVNGNGNRHRNGNGNGHVSGNGHRNGIANGNGHVSEGVNGNGAPTRQYGPPNFQSGAPIAAIEDPLAEPASYKFSYKVEDAEAGLDFGHQEEREGDEALGEYSVLLPDGRTLIVTYKANQDGYQPEIKFEEAKGGYSKGPNGY